MMSLRRSLKLLAGMLLTLFVVAFLALWVQKAAWDSRYHEGYDPNLPLEAISSEPENREGYRRVEFRFLGIPGEVVPGVMALPMEGSGPFPCVVFLHGIGQNKSFLDEIALPFVENGFVLVSFDQYTRGERKQSGLRPLSELKALYRRGSLTVTETRRLLDYLETREEISSDRLYMCGASYGAMTGSTASAFDDRIQAVILCYGGGNLHKLLDNRAALEMLADQPKGRWLQLAVRGIGPFFAWFFGVFDPCRYVAGISPRPVLFQNGTHDILIPTPAAEAFQNAAKEPKEILWYDSDHVGMDREHTEQVLYDAISWLGEQDRLIHDSM